jgi:radical SAM/Cys-rich protein
VQINVGRLCNQSCIHCHVDAGPERKEIMGREKMAQAAEFVECAGATTVDITGGAPEMNPNFRWLLERMSDGSRSVIVRSNLTVLLERGNEDLPDYFAKHGVEVIASLPCYTQANVDRQRGVSAFCRSVEALHRLNAVGYGQAGSRLTLSLVYNPLGASLPGAQEHLEKDYKQHLKKEHGIVFNRLLTITNAPIGRFALALRNQGQYETYYELLANAFNPATVSNLMCKEMVSISWDGCLYDCDFNQAVGYAPDNGHPPRLADLPAHEIVAKMLNREITVASHCFACTAGAGSSCQGALQA